MSWFTDKRRDDYHYSEETVAGGVTNQEVNISGSLQLASRQSAVGPPHYLKISTDVAITVRFNKVTNAAVPVAAGATSALVLPCDALRVIKLYLSHTGVCGAGAASVKIWAS